MKRERRTRAQYVAPAREAEYAAGRCAAGCHRIVLSDGRRLRRGVRLAIPKVRERVNGISRYVR